MAGASSPVQSIIGGVALLGFYGFTMWQVTAKNPGKRVVECGGIALVVFFAMAAAMKIPGLPDWVALGLGILFLLPSFLRIFFLMQQGYRALRGKQIEFSEVTRRPFVD
jgi:hypothetical protein